MNRITELYIVKFQYDLKPPCAAIGAFKRRQRRSVYVAWESHSMQFVCELKGIEMGRVGINADSARELSQDAWGVLCRGRIIHS